MDYIEKLYYNMHILNERYADMPEEKEASNRLEEALGDELYRKYEDEICAFASANEKQGFIYGFQYAVSLMTNGKGIEDDGSITELTQEHPDKMITLCDAIFNLSIDHERATVIADEIDQGYFDLKDDCSKIYYFDRTATEFDILGDYIYRIGQKIGQINKLLCQCRKQRDTEGGTV